ncbi:MAG: hypothetical protein ISP49_02290 [Reyranella sp.]|nr:hypothetical protein [Reyranella sp.]MBL6650390.1 hypothetical protein [Reyranella sp.]
MGSILPLALVAVLAIVTTSMAAASSAGARQPPTRTGDKAELKPAGCPWAAAAA